MRQLMEFFYYSGNCHTSAAARNQIANNFIKIMGIALQETGKGGCDNPTFRRHCSASNVKIRCGAIVPVSGRRRRSTQVCGKY